MESGSSASRAQAPSRRASDHPIASPIELPPDLVEALRPWVNVEEVGAAGFLSWLRSVLPLLPRSAATGRKLLASPTERIQELAAALSECSSDRARVHFQAAEYYRENQVLARRMKALEATLRSAAPGQARTEVPEEDPEAENAGRRYLPKREQQP